MLPSQSPMSIEAPIKFKLVLSRTNQERYFRPAIVSLQPFFGFQSCNALTPDPFTANALF
ncbi:MAG: hypothetical protein ACI9P7_001836 [Candidatus Azotimanducaceae bacterium]